MIKWAQLKEITKALFNAFLVDQINYDELMTEVRKLEALVENVKDFEAIKFTVKHVVQSKITFVVTSNDKKIDYLSQYKKLIS